MSSAIGNQRLCDYCGIKVINKSLIGEKEAYCKSSHKILDKSVELMFTGIGIIAFGLIIFILAPNARLGKPWGSDSGYRALFWPAVVLSGLVLFFAGLVATIRKRGNPNFGKF